MSWTPLLLASLVAITIAQAAVIGIPKDNTICSNPPAAATVVDAAAMFAGSWYVAGVTPARYVTCAQINTTFDDSQRTLAVQISYTIDCDTESHIGTFAQAPKDVVSSEFNIVTNATDVKGKLVIIDSKPTLYTVAWICITQADQEVVNNALVLSRDEKGLSDDVLAPIKDTLKKIGFKVDGPNYLTVDNTKCDGP